MAVMTQLQGKGRDDQSRPDDITDELKETQPNDGDEGEGSDGQ
jgi:hypothetical protein